MVLLDAPIMAGTPYDERRDSALHPDDASRYIESICPTSLADRKAVKTFLEDALRGAPLPIPWVAARDNSGNISFKNPTTGISSFRHPLEPSIKELFSICRVCLALPQAAQQSCLATLLETWEAEAKFEYLKWNSVVDPASGKTYYCNCLSGESMWEHPTEALLPAHFVKLRALGFLRNSRYIAKLNGALIEPIPQDGLAVVTDSGTQWDEVPLDGLALVKAIGEQGEEHDAVDVDESPDSTEEESFRGEVTPVITRLLRPAAQREGDDDSCVDELGPSESDGVRLVIHDVSQFLGSVPHRAAEPLPPGSAVLLQTCGLSAKSSRVPIPRRRSVIPPSLFAERAVLPIQEQVWAKQSVQQLPQQWDGQQLAPPPPPQPLFLPVQSFQRGLVMGTPRSDIREESIPSSPASSFNALPFLCTPR